MFSRIFFIISCILLLGSFLLSNSNSNRLVKDYYSDDSGNVYMYINVLGHVKFPGTYMIYEDADILTILSQAGGPMQGAKLKEVIIRHDNGTSNVFNLNSILYDGEILNIELKPNDTIYIKQNWGSYILEKSSFVNSLFHVLNIYLTITNR